MTLTVQFLVLIALAIYAGAGAVAMKRPISDFYGTGAMVPAVFNGMAIAASFIAVLAFAGLAGALVQQPEGRIAVLAGGAVGLTLIALLLAPYFRKFGGYTIPDFLGERFGGTALRPLAVLAVILCSFPALVLALLGVALIAVKVFAIGAVTALAVSVAMLLLCTFAGGVRSATHTQVAQYAVLLMASVGVLAILLWQQGAWLPDFSTIGFDDAIKGLRLETFAAEDPVNRFALAFCLAVGTASLPHLLMHSFTARSVKEAQTSFLLALPFAGVVCLAAPAYLSLFGPPPAESSDVIPVVSFGLSAIGGISALLALASGLVLAIANALSYDIYYRSLHLTAPTERRLFIARTAIVLVAGLAAVVAFVRPETMVRLAGVSFSLAASALLPALLLGMWWKRATGEGALAGMIASVGVCLYYMLAPVYLPFGFYETSSLLSNASPEQIANYAAQGQSYYLTDPGARDAALAAWEETARAVANWWGVSRDFAALFAVPVGLLVTAAVSLFTTAPSRDVQSFVEELRKPTI